MVEDLALQYSALPESDVRSIHYGLLIIGGIFGGLTNRSLLEIQRAPYFALNGLVFLGVAVVTVVAMTFIVQALIGGFVWVVVGLELLTSVIAGFFIARIAIARSRDAYGDGRKAALAFIPFAALWLLGTPSKNALSANRFAAIPLLSGGVGVLFGIVLFVVGIWLVASAQVDATKRVEAATASGAFSVATLDSTLSTMASEVQTPQTVDEATTLLRMEAVGSELRYVYQVDAPIDLLPTDMRMGLIEQNCAYEGLSGVIDAGATIKHIYLRKDGSEIGAVEVTRQTCGRDPL